MNKAMSLLVSILTLGIGRLIAPAKNIAKTLPSVFGFFLRKTVTTAVIKEVATRLSGAALEKLAGSLIEHVCKQTTERIAATTDEVLNGQFAEIEETINLLYDASYEPG